MAKVSIQDMAFAIVAKYGLSQNEAEDFVSALFDIVNEGLHSDKVAKVKGLGTFKVIGVRDRESVNVNTGERVVIEGHDKITFTPDAVMRDLVNKPFAQFETVVLNEGVDLEEMGKVLEADDNDALTDDAEQELAETVQSVQPVSEEEPADDAPDTVDVIGSNDGVDILSNPVEDVALKAEQPVVDIPTLPEQAAEDEKQDFDDSAVTDEDVAETLDSDNCSGKPRRWWVLSVLIAFVVGVAAFAAGFYFGRGSVVSVEPVIKPKTVSVASKPLAKVDTPRVKAVQDTVKVGQSKDSLNVSTPKKDVTAEVVDKDMPTVVSQELRNAKAMVNTGAYRIIGTDRLVTVKPGETLKGISKFYLGDGMECYVQVHNGISEVKEGMKLKIPKLKNKLKK